MTSHSLTLAACVFAPTLSFAAPVDLWSELSFTHRFVINNGIPRADIAAVSIWHSEYGNVHESNIDEPTAQSTQSVTFESGDNYPNPPTPSEYRVVNTTYVPGVDRFARADYSLSRFFPPSPTPFPVQLAYQLHGTYDNSGRAEVRSDTGQSDANARAYYGEAVPFFIGNQSEDPLITTLSGDISFTLTSRARGETGEARTSITLFSELILSDGASVEVIYSEDPITYDQSVSGGVAYANGHADEEGFEFTAFGRSLADPLETRANVSGGASYTYRISLEPEAYVRIIPGYEQSNIVDYTAPPATTPPNVPLPASFGFLLASTLGAFALRR